MVYGLFMIVFIQLYHILLYHTVDEEMVHQLVIMVPSGNLT